MSMVRRKSTEPELAVRRLVRSIGFTYRLNGPDLPGKPDLVFLRERKVIFVHGCFWHRHWRCARGQREPLRNACLWRAKRDRNAKRDRRNVRALQRLGWSVLIVWECSLRDPDRVRLTIARFLAVRSCPAN
jgi:DNA mismatch endonuclease, patch repair protein